MSKIFKPKFGPKEFIAKLGRKDIDEFTLLNMVFVDKASLLSMEMLLENGKTDEANEVFDFVLDQYAIDKYRTYRTYITDNGLVRFKRRNF